MKSKYKIIVAIAVGLIVLIGFITINSSSNKSKMVADDTAKLQAEPQATQDPLMQELKLTQEEAKRQIESAREALTNAPTPIVFSTSVASTDTGSS